jgi:YD repeat-containing protein
MATSWISPDLTFKVIQVKGTSGDANGLLEFLCEAEPATARATAQWRIRKFVYDSTGFMTKVLWADGDRKFDNSASNPSSLTYSDN